MYLPHRLYELLPSAYVAAGLLLCVGSYLGRGSPWSDSMFAVGGVAIVVGIVLMLRRRSYRDDAARYDPHSLDD